MSKLPKLRVPRGTLVFLLTLLSLTSVGAMLPAHAPPTGTLFSNLVVILMENESFCSVYTGCGGSGTYESNLANQNVLVNTWGTIAHNSEPNYVALLGAINDPATYSDGVCCFFEPQQNLVDRLETAGLTWTAWAESAGGSGTCSFSPPRSGDHFPFLDFADMNTAARCSHFQSTTAPTDNEFVNSLTTGAPNFIWLTPTDGDNGHDPSGCVTCGDNYLAQLVPRILASPLFTAPGSKAGLLITYDEGYNQCANTGGTGECLYTSVSGPAAKKAAQISPAQASHYSLAKTLETNWGLLSLNAGDVNAPDISGAFGSGTGGPLPLTVGAVQVTPANPTPNNPFTVSVSVSGGTTPYSYSWSVGGATATGNPATFTLTSQGSFTATVTVTDAQSHTGTASQPFTVSSSGGCGSSCPTPGGAPPPLFGWGGIRLDEAAVGAGGINANNLGAASCCFSGEQATNMELVMKRLVSLNYNTIRVDFDPSCTDNTDQNYMSAFSQVNLQRALTLAQFYKLWILVDYHGYIDFQLGTSGMVLTGYPSLRACWLAQWQPIVNQFKNSYTGLIWEPLNEPCYGTMTLQGGGANCTAGTDVATLSGAYQAWINQARAAGDNHWILVQNLCSNSCGFADYSQGYPTVTDTLKSVLISLHAYMGFQFVAPWTIQEADNYAYQFYQWMVTGQKNTGWASVNTEVGADPLCDITACPTAGWGSCSNPPTTCSGSAGFTTVTFEFVRYLRQLMLNNNPSIGWIGWTAGSWTNTPGAPLYGSLDPTGWGTSLGSIPLSTTGGGGSVSVLFSPTVIFAILAVTGVGGVGVALAAAGRRRHSRSGP